MPKYDGTEAQRRGPICLRIYGSSHATIKHKFGPTFGKLIGLPKNGWFKQRFTKPMVHGASGRRLDDDFVRKVIEDLDWWKGGPQTVCLIIGTNNLRRVRPKDQKKGLEQETPEQVFERYKKILDYSRSIGRSHVVCISLIPDSQQDGLYKEPFNKLSQMIRKYVEHDRTRWSYLNVASFLTKKGAVRIGYYKDNNIHLQIQGTTLLINKLLQLLRRGITNASFKLAED